MPQGVTILRENRVEIKKSNAVVPGPSQTYDIYVMDETENEFRTIFKIIDKNCVGSE